MVVFVGLEVVVRGWVVDSGDSVVVDRGLVVWGKGIEEVGMDMVGCGAIFRQEMQIEVGN